MHNLFSDPISDDKIREEQVNGQVLGISVSICNFIAPNLMTGLLTSHRSLHLPSLTEMRHVPAHTGHKVSGT